MNPALSTITGYSEGELLSTSFQAITHPDDVDGDIHNTEELLEGKIDFYEVEKRYIHKNGSIVWILLSISAVREKGQSLFFISQVQEITERKQLELELYENEVGSGI